MVARSAVANCMHRLRQQVIGLLHVDQGLLHFAELTQVPDPDVVPELPRMKKKITETMIQSTVDLEKMMPVKRSMSCP